MVEILIPITFFLSCFGTLYVYFSARNRERMALIEKGLSAELLSAKRKYPKSFWALRIGLLLVGLGLGFLFGRILEVSIDFGHAEPVPYFSMIFLFGGIALVSSFFLERRMSREDQDFDI